MVKKHLAHLCVLCALGAALLSGLSIDLRDALTDLRFRLFPREASRELVIVAIDPRSLDELGVWPWPRSLHAQLIERLKAAEVGEIAFDVDFSSRSNAESDKALLEALKSAGGSVVLPAFQQSAGRPGAANHVTMPLPEFGKNAWVSAVNVRTEPSGLVRQYRPGETLGASYLPSMPAVLARRTDLSAEPFIIDFSIRPQSVPVVSYIDVLRGETEILKSLSGKSIIIGSTAVELGDRFSVPVFGVISGPMLQTLAAESLLQHRDLHRASPAVVFAGPALIAFMMLALWRRSSGVARALLLAGASVMVEAGAVLLQARLPFALDTSYLHTAVAAYLLAVAFDEINIRGLLRRVAESRFQRFAASVGDGLACADSRHRITAWNPSAATIFGYEAAQAIGRPLDMLWASGHGEGGFSVSGLSGETLRRPGGITMELSGRRSSGEVFPIEVCFSGWDGPDGLQCGAVMRDISARRREELRIRYLAEHDTVTGLLNRDALYARACAHIDGPDRSPDGLALLIVGINNFDDINDMLGHACGDEMLRAISDRLTTLFGEAASLARLNGAEFALLLPDDADGDAAKSLCAHVSRAFGEGAIEVRGGQHRISTSTGVAVYPRDCSSAEELFGCAHLALGRAKGAGAGEHVFFDQRIRDEIEARLKLEGELAQALERGEFELFYQPQVRLPDASLVGAEALIRWRHPGRGLVSPAEFMPVVNSSRMSDQVAIWVLETACRQASAWEQGGYALRIGVNLSPSLIQSGELLAIVGAALRRSCLSPSLLELEVTEDILLTDEEDVLAMFRKLRDLGVRIVFDDFGTGYASLSYLKKLPLDGLKIDRSFVKDLGANSGDAAIVGCTITLARLLGLSVIAEGIEDEATARLLAEMGSEEGQGYFFGRPMPAAELDKRLVAGAMPSDLDSTDARAVSAA